MEDFLHYLRLSRNNNQEDIDTATEYIQTVMSTPEIFQILTPLIEGHPESQILNIQMNEVDIDGTLVYFAKAVQYHWSSLDPSMKEQVKQLVLNAMFTTPSMKRTYNISAIIGDIIKCDGLDSWPSIFGALAQADNNEEAKQRSVLLISSILKDFTEERIKNSMETLMQHVDFGFNSKDVTIQCASIDILRKVLSVNEKFDMFEAHLTLLQHIARESIAMNDTDFMLFWNSISRLFSKIVLPNEYLIQYFEVCIECASDVKRPAYHRYLSLAPTLAMINFLDEEKLQRMIIVDLQICADFVKSEETLPESQLFGPIENTFALLPRNTVYQLLKKCMSELYDHEFSVISVAVLRIVLLQAPELALSDSSFFMETLAQALDSQDDLIMNAACHVLKAFGDSVGSMNQFCMVFIPRLVPLLLTENEELRMDVYEALDSLCRILDTKLAGFFELVWKIKDQVSDDNYGSYCILLGSSISNSEEFTDDQLDMLIEYLEEVFADEDIEYSSSALHIVPHLLNIDEELVSILLEPSLKIVYAALNGGSEDALSTTIAFLDMIVPFVSNDESFLEIINYLSDLINEPDALSERIRGQAMLTCCHTAKARKDRTLAAKMQEHCSMAFQSSEESVILDGTSSCCMIARLLDPDDVRQLFLTIIEFIRSDDSPRLISEALKALTKLLKATQGERRTKAVDDACQLVSEFIEGKHPAFVGFGPLSGNCDHVLMTNIAYFLSEIVQTPSQYVDELCQFMLHIIKMPDEMSQYSYVGAFSDAIKFGTASKETVQDMFALIPELMERATEPDLQHNLVFMLNFLCKMHPDLIPDILRLVPLTWQWFEKARQNSSGYQLFLANAASFYLTLATRVEGLDDSIILAALSEFPAYDRDETVPMAENIFNMVEVKNVQQPDIVYAICQALTRLLLFDSAKLAKHLVTDEVIERATQILRRLTGQYPEITHQLLRSYQKTKQKYNRIQRLLQ